MMLATRFTLAGVRRDMTTMRLGMRMYTVMRGQEGLVDLEFRTGDRVGEGVIDDVGPEEVEDVDVGEYEEHLIHRPLSTTLQSTLGS